jgi:signal transduction histidine kinase
MEVRKTLAGRIWARLDGSLRTRILIPTALLFALTLFVSGFAMVELHGRGLEAAMREQGEMFLDVLAYRVDRMLDEGADLTLALATVSAHRGDIRSMSIIDCEGKVAYSSRPERVGVQRWDASQLACAGSTWWNGPDEDALLRPLVDAAGRHHCDYGTSPNGWVEVLFSRESVVAVKQRLARSLAVTSIPLLLALLGIAWWLVGRESIKPIQRLVAVMGRAEKGDLDVRADEGRPDEIGIAARGFDATLAALRKSQQEIETLYQQRMVRADRFATVGEMATGLAHEIKNPLAGLSGALELLAEDLRSDPRHGEMVAEMVHQVDRLATIMDGLLNYARAPKVKLRTTDVNATLETVLFLVSQQRRASPVILERAFSPVLPPIAADPSLLEQVFLNLCLNAVQAMDGKGGKLTLRSLRREDAVVVEIADTGPGIPEDVRPNIFKPFYTTRKNGTGLGLAISARIVEEHGGRMEFTCPPGGGTIFSVSLPIALSRPAAQA